MDHNDVVRRNDQLDDRIAGSPDIDALVRASKRNRRLITYLAISVGLDVLLSLGLGALAWRANQLALQADSIEARAYATCVAGNEARAGQVELWGYILTLPPTSPRTPAQQQQADDFKAYVERLFAPRRC